MLRGSTSDLHLDRHLELDAELPKDILLPVLDRMERTSAQQEALDNQLRLESERAAQAREARTADPTVQSFDLDGAQPAPSSDAPPPPPPPPINPKRSQGAQTALQREYEQLHPNHNYFPPGPPPETLTIPATQLPSGLHPTASTDQPHVTLQLARYHRALRTVWRLPTEQGWSTLLVRETLVTPGQRSPASFNHVEWVPSGESSSATTTSSAPTWSSVLQLVQPWLTMRYPTLEEAHMLLVGSAGLPSSSPPTMP